MIERRKHVRSELKVAIRVTHPKHGQFILQTDNFSDGGAYIYCPESLEIMVGDEITAQVLSMGEGEPPIIKLRVVRRDKTGFGSTFID